MKDDILDETVERNDLQYSSLNSNKSILKGTLGLIVTVALTTYYLWFNITLNGSILLSGRSQGVINGLLIYAILIFAYSIISILLGIKMKQNNQNSCRNLEIASTFIQITIGLILLADWWYTFELIVI